MFTDEELEEILNKCNDYDYEFKDDDSDFDIFYDLQSNKRYRYFHIDRLPKSSDKEAIVNELSEMAKWYGRERDMEIIASGDYIVLFLINNGLYCSGFADKDDLQYKAYQLRIENLKLLRRLKRELNTIEKTKKRINKV